MGKTMSLKQALFDPAGIAINDNAKNAKAAADAQDRANASQVAAEQATQNMNANFATDLNADNAGTVIAGGTADAVASTADDLKKKKAQGLSTQLGINV